MRRVTANPIVGWAPLIRTTKGGSGHRSLAWIKAAPPPVFQAPEDARPRRTRSSLRPLRHVEVLGGRGAGSARDVRDALLALSRGTRAGLT